MHGCQIWTGSSTLPNQTNCMRVTKVVVLGFPPGREAYITKSQYTARGPGNLGFKIPKPAHGRPQGTGPQPRQWDR
jgi:hypothetical protein